MTVIVAFALAFFSTALVFLVRFRQMSGHHYCIDIAASGLTGYPVPSKLQLTVGSFWTL